MVCQNLVLYTSAESVLIYLFFLGQTEGNFHVVILNKQVDQAYKELRDFIINELEKQQAEGIYVNLTPASNTD